MGTATATPGPWFRMWSATDIPADLPVTESPELRQGLRVRKGRFGIEQGASPFRAGGSWDQDCLSAASFPMNARFLSLCCLRSCSR